MAERNIKFVKRIRNLIKGRKVVPDDKEKKSSEWRADTSAQMQIYRRMEQWYSNYLTRANTRKDKYEKYNYLDDNLSEAEVSLNIYADSIVAGQQGGKENYFLTIDEDTPNIEELEEVVKTAEQRSEIKNAIWDIARTTTGYGDDFEEVVVKEEDGKLFIDKLKPLPKEQMYAEVDDRGVLKDPLFPYSQRPTENRKDDIPLDWWRVIHFKQGREVYGVDHSIFSKSSQRVGRQLIWINESMVLARLSRAWQRYAFFVDVEGLSPEQRWEFVDKFMEQMKRKEVITQDTGRINLIDNPPLPDEDIAIPVGQTTGKHDLRVLSGDSNIGNIEDVKYIQREFFMSTNIPKAYAGLEEGTRGKATLTQIDVQFARQVRRRQNSLKPGLRDYYKLVFTFAGIDFNSFSWDIVFPELGTTDELIHWEIEKLKLEVGKIAAVDIGAVNMEYILRKLLNLTDEEVEKYAVVLPVFPGIESVQLTPQATDALRKNPYVRQMLSDLKDIVGYRVARDQALSGMKTVGVGRSKELGN